MAEHTNADIRAWARAHGHAVADRGRIPAAVLAAHADAHPDPAGYADDDRDPVPTPRRAAPSEGARPGRVDRAPASRAAPPPGPPPPTGGAPAPTRPWDRPSPSAPDPAPEGPKGRDGFAWAAVAFGIVPILFGLIGIAFGLVALQRTRRSHQKGRGIAIVGIVLGSCWLLGLLVVLVVGAVSAPDRADDGALASGGTVTYDKIRERDCLATYPERPTPYFRVVPCSELHEVEVYAVVELEGSRFPGKAELDRLAEASCSERLAGYVGPGRTEDFRTTEIQPNDGTWSDGHREVHCLLFGLAPGSLSRGSAKAS